MAGNKFSTLSLCAIPGVIVFVELYLLLPVNKHVTRIMACGGKSLAVMKSQKISDHWKEKVLLRYSRQTMSSSVVLGFLLGLLLLGFCAAYLASGFLIIGDIDEIVQSFKRMDTQLVIFVWGLIYSLIRCKNRKQKDKVVGDYTPSSKLLHYITLNNSLVKELAFDIDCMITGSKSSQQEILSPVYITSLARAGTTILLEAVYATGHFATLTYRDMPLVTAPNLWKKLTETSKIKSTMKQKKSAHMVITST